MGIWYSVLALVNLLAGGFLCTSVYGFDAGTATDIGFALSIALQPQEPQPFNGAVTVGDVVLYR